MRVKLVYIDRDFRGSELSRREEILHGESAKSLTRNHVARLIQQHHPDLQHAGGVRLSKSYEADYTWLVKVLESGRNRWTYVYAEPLDTAVSE